MDRMKFSKKEQKCLQGAACDRNRKERKGIYLQEKWLWKGNKNIWH